MRNARIGNKFFIATEVEAQFRLLSTKYEAWIIIVRNLEGRWGSILANPNCSMASPTNWVGYFSLPPPTLPSRMWLILPRVNKIRLDDTRSVKTLASFTLFSVLQASRSLSLPPNMCERSILHDAKGDSNLQRVQVVQVFSGPRNKPLWLFYES